MLAEIAMRVAEIAVLDVRKFAFPSGWINVTTFEVHKAPGTRERGGQVALGRCLLFVMSGAGGVSGASGASVRFAPMALVKRVSWFMST